jgi:hypothetical protein
LAGVWTDWLLLKNGILDTTEELVNVVKVALLTDSLSDIEEILPDPDSTDRRGWWGDSFPPVDGHLTGSRLWTLAREKQTEAVVERARGLLALEGCPDLRQQSPRPRTRLDRIERRLDLMHAERQFVRRLTKPP